MAQSFPKARVNQLIGEDFGQSLENVGFGIIDGLLGSDWTNGLRQEIKKLYDQGLLVPNKTYYEGRKDENGRFVYGYSVSKPNVHELDLSTIELQKRKELDIPHLNALYEDETIQKSINRAAPDFNITKLDIKIQYNAGEGGCFPMHFDTTTNVSKRRVTGTLYLNPDWIPEHGGQLRVYPFPYDIMDVDPLNDRLVLFSSHETLHRVMPSHAPARYCITLWYYVDQDSPQSLQIPRFSWLRQVEGIGFLLNPNTRKLLSKIVYDNHWRESVRQSFGEQKEEIEKILANHNKEVEHIKKQLSPEILDFLLQCVPLAHGEDFLKLARPIKGE
ncbi:hypothetical protein PROFUN_08785 [Planoprotostelium fungivorum]|uniref:Fe2OG dioxygenase domain-containing protein n=1 Tax=Planoprotostelium fungivorum TaxID=1890364 RepID=A0A2P6MVP9_9EUKA|nr:hypothetical protein PROFUN_08785 [Planoprotostelium fungivorum]